MKQQLWFHRPALWENVSESLRIHFWRINDGWLVSQWTLPCNRNCGFRAVSKETNLEIDIDSYCGTNSILNSILLFFLNESSDRKRPVYFFLKALLSLNSLRLHWKELKKSKIWISAWNISNSSSSSSSSNNNNNRKVTLQMRESCLVGKFDSNNNFSWPVN